jgi:hypothetical protein
MNLILPLQTFLISLVSIIILIGTGWVLLNLFRIKFERNLFFTQKFAELILGTIVLTSFWAIIHTKGLTIHVLNLIILYIIYKNIELKNNNSTLKNDLNFINKNYIFLILGVSAIFTINYINSSEISNFRIKSPYYDMVYYASVSDFLSITGIENDNHGYNFLDNENTKIQPYHYSELWLCNLITFIFKNLSIINIQFVVPSIYIFNFLLGIFAFFEFNKQKINLYILLISVVFIGTGGIYLNWYKNFDSLNFIYIADILSKPWKIGLLYTIVQGSIILLLYTQYRSAILVLLLGIIVNVGFTFAAFGGLVLCLILLFLNKKITLKKVIELISLTLLTIITIYITYSILGRKNHTTLSNPLTNNKKFEHVFLMVKVFKSSFINTILLVIPIVFTFLIVFKNKLNVYFERYKTILILTLGAWIGGMLIWAFLYKSTDSCQFFIFTFPAFCCCLIILLNIEIILKFNSFNLINKCLSAIYLVFITSYIIYNYTQTTTIHQNNIVKINDEQYISQVSKEIKSSNSNYTLIGFIPDSNFVNSIHPYYRQSFMNMVGKEYIGYIKNNISLMDLGNFCINNKSDIYNNYLRNSILNKYNIETKGKKTIAHFIIEKNIRFIFLSKNIDIPKELNSIIDRKYTDSVTGERFLILKNHF